MQPHKKITTKQCAYIYGVHCPALDPLIVFQICTTHNIFPRDHYDMEDS